MRDYPRAFPRWLFGMLAAAGLSGVVLIPSALVDRLGWAVVWRLSGGPRNLAGAIHVAAGFGLAALLGAVWAIHVRRNWPRGVNRRSGASVFVALVLLALTGIGGMYLIRTPSRCRWPRRWRT